jgi:formylmethanofuran dehydrogenase subunit C
VSDVVTLTLRAPIAERAEFDGLRPDRLATMTTGQIETVPVWLGSRRASLGDFFRVSGESAPRVRIEGDLSNFDGVGAGCAGGEMLIEGNVGHRAGALMTAGWIDIRGNAADDAGVGMQGGGLRITGNAGQRVGSAAPGAGKGMTGGEIVVMGSAGRDAAARMRRGLLVVGGHAGDEAARAIIAGTVVVFGNTGANAGRGSKRGSIVALGSIDVPLTYTFACTYEPTYLRLLLTYLDRRYGIAAADAVLNGRFARYCGDGTDPGRGEILVYSPP